MRAYLGLLLFVLLGPNRTEAQIVQTVIGTYHTGTGYSGDGGPAIQAVFDYPVAIQFDAAGNLYIVDFQNARLRKVDASTNLISTFAGNGLTGFSGDGGVATGATLTEPQDIEMDHAGNIYIVDYGNNRIRKIDRATNVITTVAGNGASIVSDAELGGPALNRSLIGPNGIAFDAAGNLYIANTYDNDIERVDVNTQIITRIAGSNIIGGFSGDGGLAINSRLNFPWSIAFDSHDNLFFVDYVNFRVRRIDALTHIITTVAGNGATDGSGEGGPAVNASLTPYTVKFDPMDNLYISTDNRIQKVDATTQVITTVAGSLVAGYTGDGGAPTDATFKEPTGMAFDQSGNLYIADNSNNVIRKIVPGLPLPTTLESFTGALLANQQSRLTWKTSLEEGTASFGIEYSKDAAHFYPIATIPASGTPDTYYYLHCCPTSGDNFYRLRLTDRDGKFTYSGVIDLKYNAAQSFVKIFPNPTAAIAFISFSPSVNNDQIQILNATGTIIKTISISKDSQMASFSVKGLAKGIYIVRFVDGVHPVTKLMIR